MVIKDCILKASEILRASGVQSYGLDARVLLCHVLKKDDVYVVVNSDLPVSKEDENQFFDLVKRRATQEPVAYIVGKKEFMSLDFYVDKNVLIPRPDTEHLAELAIEAINENGFENVADFCTGSGALAISVALNCPGIKMTGFDISESALCIAEKNKMLHRANNVSFKKLDVLTELPALNEKYDAVISNPPYIDGAEMKGLDRTVAEFEPHFALYGGEDGLDFYRTITENAPLFLKNGGVLAFEVGHTQAKTVAHLMKANFENIQIKKDYAGIERVVVGKLSEI